MCSRKALTVLALSNSSLMFAMNLRDRWDADKKSSSRGVYEGCWLGESDLRVPRTSRLRATVPECRVLGGGFNRSAQHLLILRGEEVCHGDVADLVHGSAEGRAVGAMEEWAKCCGHLAGVGKEEQDWR